jgi:hypothetical protein
MDINRIGLVCFLPAPCLDHRYQFISLKC